MIFATFVSGLIVGYSVCMLLHLRELQKLRESSLERYQKLEDFIKRNEP